mmetsp:Transcript_6384/g.7302  ORF Transcript_6384/g.7302 Transcript_6384/m.7302 type:complete len:478 (-) Transcript_6384:34-1467(-)
MFFSKLCRKNNKNARRPAGREEIIDHYYDGVSLRRLKEKENNNANRTNNNLKTTEALRKLKEKKQKNNDANNRMNNNLKTTGALMETVIFPMVIPIVERSIMNSFIAQGILFRNNKVIEASSSTENLLELELEIDDIIIMDPKVVMEDIKAAPDFNWPEHENIAESLHNINTSTKTAQFHWPENNKMKTMIVLDLVGFDCLKKLGEGVEFVYPVKLPFGGKANIEIGSGGKIRNPWIRIEIPRVRVFFQTETKKLYIVLMEKPFITPYLHINANRGNGDFMNFLFTEDTQLDNIVERTLYGFGPKQFLLQSDNKYNNDKKKKQQRKKTKKTKRNDLTHQHSSPSWISNAIGDIITNKIQQSLLKSGLELADIQKGNIPLKIDISGTINSSINSALGIPRPLELIEADIARFQKELEVAAKKVKGENNDNKVHDTITTTNTPSTVAEDENIIKNDSFSTIASLYTFILCLFLYYFFML